MGERASCIHILKGDEEGGRFARLARGGEDGPLVVLQDVE
jgi:hypothetical protein